MLDTTHQTGKPATNASEIRLYSATGERLYLDAEAPAERMYGRTLHYTGCRPTEALQLTVGRVLVSQSRLWRIAQPQKAQNRPHRS